MRKNDCLNVSSQLGKILFTSNAFLLILHISHMMWNFSRYKMY